MWDNQKNPWTSRHHVAVRPHSTLRRQLAHLKDTVPMDQPKAWFTRSPVLSASRCMLDSLAEPWSTASVNTDRWALQKGDVAASALVEHVWFTGHQVNLSKAEVIDSHPFVTTSKGASSRVGTFSATQTRTLNWEKGTLPREYRVLLD